ncbi:MAG TPA: hypothetical protein VNT27_16510 [Propionibacteriaceae bacterium]|nr:hypothetical protein [Propionibacteriaceae bacterium]
MGIDPQDRQIIDVTGGQVRERGYAHRALSAQRDNTGGVVPPDDLEGVAELVNDGALRLDAVHLLQTDVADLDRHRNRGSGVRRQHRLKHRRSHRVPTACHIKREFRGKASHAGGAGALPLRPHQPQRRFVSAATGDCV